MEDERKEEERVGREEEGCWYNEMRKREIGDELQR